MKDEDAEPGVDKSVSLSAGLTGASGVALVVAPGFWRDLLMLPPDVYPGVVVLLGLSLVVNAFLLNLVQNGEKQ